MQVVCRAWPGFRVVMFVVNGSCRSSFLAVRRVGQAGSAGRKDGVVQVGAGGGRRLAFGPVERAPVVVPSAGELRDVAEVAGFA
jgi:hypothetical protein